MNEKINRIILYINGFALFVVLLAWLCLLTERYNNERLKSVSMITEQTANNLKVEAEYKHLQSENLKLQYYKRLIDDAEYKSMFFDFMEE